MPRPVVVERRCELTVDADAAWARVTSPAGVRHELAPVLGMTTPPGLRDLDLSDPGLVGRPLGKAWLLLGRVLPVDYDDMTLVEVGERRFHERSRMLALRSWEHERDVVRVAPGRCAVTDRLTFVPRVPGRVARAVCARLVGALFSHRQRRLARWAASAGR